MAAALLADSAQDLRVVVGRAESLHVVVAGHGEPVVLLPGLFGSAYGFRKVIPLLTGAGYRILVVEPLGWGRRAGQSAPTIPWERRPSAWPPCSTRSASKMRSSSDTRSEVRSRSDCRSAVPIRYAP